MLTLQSLTYSTSLDTPSYSFIIVFNLYINTEDIKIMTDQIWNYVVNNNVLTQNMFYILNSSKYPPFSLMKVCTLLTFSHSVS